MGILLSGKIEFGWSDCRSDFGPCPSDLSLRAYFRPGGITIPDSATEVTAADIRQIVPSTAMSTCSNQHVHGLIGMIAAHFIDGSCITLMSCLDDKPIRLHDTPR